VVQLSLKIKNKFRKLKKKVLPKKKKKKKEEEEKCGFTKPTIPLFLPLSLSLIIHILWTVAMHGALLSLALCPFVALFPFSSHLFLSSPKKLQWPPHHPSTSLHH
jgi:hypothetical protein